LVLPGLTFAAALVFAEAEAFAFGGGGSGPVNVTLMEQKTNQQQQRQPALACTVNFHWFQWSLESSRAPQAALPLQAGLSL
jgi:hypothetical protein